MLRPGAALQRLDEVLFWAMSALTARCPTTANQVLTRRLDKQRLTLGRGGRRYLATTTTPRPRSSLTIDTARSAPGSSPARPGGSTLKSRTP
jgi:hypothetical protein